MISAVVDRGNGGPWEWRTWTTLETPISHSGAVQW